MIKCINCNKKYKEEHNMKVDIGFVKVNQTQCPHCQKPVNTKIIDGKSDIVISEWND